MKRLDLMQSRRAQNGKHIYQVTKVTNSITPRIDAVLTEIEVKEYCDQDEWNVIIKGKD